MLKALTDSLVAAARKAAVNGPKYGAGGELVGREG